MALPKKVLTQLRARDAYCWHCGATDDLVPHHRKNRGMGGVGKKNTEANSVENLMLICAVWNGVIESNASLAASARGWGHKLAQYQELNTPVFDCMTSTWYVLDGDGGKTAIPRELITY